MEYQDDQPSNHTTDRADDYGEQVDRYVIRQNEVRQEEENHPHDPVDDELPQVASAAGKHQQYYYYYEYEHYYFHQPLFYIRHRRLLTQQLKSFGAPAASGPFLFYTARNFGVQLTSTYRLMRRLATARANPRTRRFFRPLMMRPRVRELLSTQITIFALMTVASPSVRPRKVRRCHDARRYTR
jgi:hypothetical protein